ncbi:acyltransferase [Methylobacterium sp. Leaf456]|uniref:acyltransferase family protein n=1 Tax=Methylobacterium sp. Leaf456 TaxID=1736382 RepID=UPI000AFE15D5|nr:acyltransferase [Methylobacterium sp. Leaf456]
MIARLATMLPRRFRAVEVAPPADAGAREAGPAGFSNIQILRGLAASAVFSHHAAAYAQLERGAGRPAQPLDTLMGIGGVAVFFAISGFLMAGLIRRDPPSTFLAHRLIRIVPTYLLVVALTVPVYAACGIAPSGIAPIALSLAPAGPRSYPLIVEWTLVFEVSFYVGLFVVAWAGLARRIFSLALLWLALLALAFVLLPEASRDRYQPPAYLLPFVAACVPFAGGLLLPRLLASGRMRPGLGLLALPLATACLFVETDAARWLSGIAAVLLVGTAASSPQVRGTGRPVRGLLALGDGSYILYLVHFPVLVVVARLLPAEWSPLSYGLVCAAVAFAVTALLGPLDLALYRTLRRRVDRAAALRLRGGLAAYLLLFLGCAAWGSTETAVQDWREVRARAALAALPPETWTSRERAERAFRERGLALPASVRGRLEAIEATATQTLVKAWAYDPATPRRAMHLALFCGGRLVGIDRPRRGRRDLAGQLGLDGLGRRRIGYGMPIPLTACPADAAPLAVVVDTDGGMGVLPER